MFFSGLQVSWQMALMLYLNEGLCRVSRVGPDDQTRVLTPLDDPLLQLVSPDVLAGVKDVVAVADHRHRHRRELVQDPLKRLLLPVPTPRDDGAARHQENHCAAVVAPKGVSLLPFHALTISANIQS